MKTVNKVIIHYAPKPSGGDFFLSKSFVSNLREDFWLERITNAISSDDCFDGIFDKKHKKTAKPLIEGLFTEESETKLIKITQLLTRRLSHYQIRNISDGFLVIILGRSDHNRFVSMIKLEKMLGTNLEKSNERYDLSYIENLILTNKTKLQKFFFWEYGIEKDKISLLDNQRFYKTKEQSGVAQFWMGQFLSCSLLKDDLTMTIDSLNFVRQYINKEVKEPELQIQMISSFIAKLNSEGKLSLKAHAKESFPEKYRDHFILVVNKEKYLKNPFRIDTSGLKEDFNTLVIEYENGATLTFPVSELKTPLRKTGTIEISPKFETTTINSKVKVINGKPPKLK